MLRGGDFVLSGAGFLGLWLVKGEMLPSVGWICVGEVGCCSGETVSVRGRDS